MKACLNCEKEYQNKREASKFCSDKCRVMYNRKHPRQTVSPLQMQALYNSMMEMIGKMGRPPENAAIAPKQAIAGHPNQTVNRVSPEALMQKYVEDRRDISDEGEYLQWVARLNEDNRLTSKQKELVKSTR